MDALKLVVVHTALKDMFRRGHFNICTIRTVLEITNRIPQREDTVLLEALHCVDFQSMPPELLKGMPILLQRVLGIELDCKYFNIDKKLLDV